ncbi:cupin domain-containing protein [Amycolatopsis mongoliensis]|uniref:Cupin domain-containing protein n=1 Tax=Amycolatopsis mongoliensis TaxID=715475 RepID=A0A9Y2JX10_9PSEU|nr:cupin domain-containing protein [Amycolatopsis sp. 4-36]WIY05753.1 cupin domain-containing protein [Amycolatopsis sp. 4-36]
MIEIRTLDRENLERAYGLDGERLKPWPALNSPFEGVWAVLRAGTESTPHAHHEYEIFIAMAGSATLVVDGRKYPFTAGDIVNLPPGCLHQVVNETDADFEYYGVWWDTEMSQQFLARHEGRSS